MYGTVDGIEEWNPRIVARAKWIHHPWIGLQDGVVDQLVGKGREKKNGTRERRLVDAKKKSSKALRHQGTKARTNLYNYKPKEYQTSHPNDMSH